MESAPKDGTAILVYVDCIVHCMTAEYSPKHHKWKSYLPQEDGSEAWSEIHPTAWMPLPLPPTPPKE